jgi:hypothetical protein
LAVLMKHLNDPLPPPRQVNPAIPEPFERIVLKALAKRPQDRYQSAAEMAQALREAAEEAEVPLPARISLPLSFTTAGAPSESVAVFSGRAREKISDAQFADPETDATLGQRLAAQRTAHAAREAGSRRARALRVGRTILITLGVGAVGNSIALMLAGLTNLWVIFERGWPIELLLASLGLCLIMDAAGSIWLLIPAAIALGNGVLFAYYTLTGNWEQWAFLWPLEPLLVAGTIVLTVWLAGQGDRAQTTRLLARALGLTAAVLMPVVAITVLVSSLFR